MKAWKHHISEHFEDGGTPTSPNGAGAGGTIFLDYDKMICYLKEDGREWHVAELEVYEDELLFEFNCNWMATILCNRLSKIGFVKL